MKREIGALALLGILIAGSVWNIRKADRLTGEIREHIEISEQAVRAGDSKYAVEQLEEVKSMLNTANLVFNGPHYSRALLSLDLSLAGTHNHEMLTAIKGIYGQAVEKSQSEICIEKYFYIGVLSEKI